jgi:hypothetical protein
VRCPGLVYDTHLGLFDVAADHTYQGPRLPADSVKHPAMVEAAKRDGRVVYDGPIAVIRMGTVPFTHIE